MTKVYHLSIFLTLVLLYACGTSTFTDSDPGEEEWIPLFDGTGIDKWIPKFKDAELGENYKDRFVFADSLLSVRYLPEDTFKGNFGHLFYLEKFSHYRLRATYRFVGFQQINGPEWAFRNNGLMLHCQDPATMEKGQEFPISLELQLLGGEDSGNRPTCNLCTPGTHVNLADTLFTPHCIESTSRTYRGDQWVTVEALVLGDSLIQHLVEGEVVMDYRKPIIGGGTSGEWGKAFVEGMPLKEGWISIQAETHPIDFKSIELLDLCGCTDKQARNYKSYYIVSDNSKCRYWM